MFVIQERAQPQKGSAAESFETGKTECRQDYKHEDCTMNNLTVSSSQLANDLGLDDYWLVQHATANLTFLQNCCTSEIF